MVPKRSFPVYKIRRFILSGGLQVCAQSRLPTLIRSSPTMADQVWDLGLRTVPQPGAPEANLRKIFSPWGVDKKIFLCYNQAGGSREINLRSRWGPGPPYPAQLANNLIDLDPNLCYNDRMVWLMITLCISWSPFCIVHTHTIHPPCFPFCGKVGTQSLINCTWTLGKVNLWFS